MVSITGRQECLSLADKAVNRERENNYGKPENNFDTIAKLWTAYLTPKLVGTISAMDVAMMMILLKVGRESTGKNAHVDNMVDIAGYAACAYELINPTNNTDN